MKKNFFYTVIALSILLGTVSCTQEVVENNEHSDNIPELRDIRATLKDFENVYESQSQTRTSVSIDNNNYQLVWSENDTIGIFPNKGFQVAFPMADGAGGKFAHFDGGGWGLKSSSTYSAYCPLIGQFYLDKTKIPINLEGQVQDANNSTAHLSAFDYMCAINSNVNESGSVNFDFNHLVFILHLRLTLPKAGVYTSLVLETNGLLTSKATLNLSNGEITRKNESDVFKLDLNNIELTSENLVLDAYMALLPVDLTDKSFKAKIFDNENNCYEVTLKSRNYEAGEFYHQARTAGDNLCAGLPVMMINTPNWQSVTSKETWLSNTSITIRNTDGTYLEALGKIKGRGNATWSYEKKPYAIKFSEKQSPFGFPANKSWVLLAEYNDRSLLRTAFMSEVSKAAGIDYTINYKHVNLFLNGEYVGVYLLTDKVEKSNNRIKIDNDGYIIEKDSYYLQEPLYFVTSLLNYGYTFKYPDADEGEIIMGDDKYLFITNFMDCLENTLPILETAPDDTNYLNYIDLPSFAKYYIAAQVTGLDDTNHYHVLKSKESKLKRMPMWDAEWSFGLWPTNALSPDVAATRNIWDGLHYYKYISMSSVFRDKVKQEWTDFLKQKTQIKDNINLIIEELSKAQEYNFAKWASTGQPLNIKFDNWQAEVDYINNFFDSRVEWLDTHIKSW